MALFLTPHLLATCLKDIQFISMSMTTRKALIHLGRFGPRMLASMVLIGALVAGAVCMAAECEDPHLAKLPDEYVAEQKKYNFAVVYSECTQGQGKTVLLYPLSNYDPFGVLPGQVVRFNRNKIEWAGIGVLFHFVNGCLTDVVAKLRIGRDGLLIADDGGIYEINRDEKLVRELSRQPLDLLPPDKVGDFLRTAPAEPCSVPDNHR
jgi:hypothetical protein